MGRVFPAALAALLVLGPAGCTGTPADPGGTPGAAATSGTEAGGSIGEAPGQDLGNGRPSVSYDGLMVRRRVVIVVHSRAEADLEGVRRELDKAATSQGVALDAISPDVLEPEVLEQSVPSLVVVLPSLATLETALTVADGAIKEGTGQLGAERLHVFQVLVHDLKFTTAAADPQALSAAVDREGILSDYLGNYETASGAGQLSFSYTGPLIADEVVDGVRSAIARQAHTDAQAIAVEPRSTAGTGVDMDKEPVRGQDAAQETGRHRPQH